MVRLPYDLRNLGITAHDFLHPSSIHGMGHTLRVSIFAAMIGQMTEHEQEGQKASVAALFHDLARSNDGEDYLHGKRAAELVEFKYKEYILSLGFTHDDIREMQYAIEWHSYDEEVPPSHPYSLTTYLLKDADALDRIRIKALNPNFLRMADGNIMIGMAKDFYYSIIKQICITHPNDESMRLACEDIKHWIDTQDSHHSLLERLSSFSSTTIRRIEDDLESPFFYYSMITF